MNKWFASSLLVFGLAVHGVSSAQVFVTHGGVLSEYGDAGNIINPALISTGGAAFAVSNSVILAGWNGSRTYEYALDGTQLSTQIHAGAGVGMAVSGSDVFILSALGTVSEYDIATGAVINSSLISGFNAGGGPGYAPGSAGIVMDASNIYLYNSSGVSKYSITGALINNNLIHSTGSGNTISGLTLSGSSRKLYCLTLCCG